jgi:hypothetical protein
MLYITATCFKFKAILRQILTNTTFSRQYTNYSVYTQRINPSLTPDTSFCRRKERNYDRKFYDTFVFDFLLGR